LTGGGRRNTVRPSHSGCPAAVRRSAGAPFKTRVALGAHGPGSFMEAHVMFQKALAWLALAVLAGSPLAASAQVKEIRWGTSQVGSVGHRSLVNLTQMLNREMKDYRFTVQPTPGAIITVKGYATGEFEGFYGADIAFYELANDLNRFKGFKASMKREPVQSFWTYTVEVGAGIHSRDKGKIKQWRDLSTQRVFTGPRPWDVRAQLERAFGALGVKHEYLEVDISTAGSLLEQGRISGFIIYTNAEATTAPWITEAGLAADWTVLNPSKDEADLLRDAGFRTVEVDAGILKKDAPGKAVVLPFYYGFHVGLEVPADDVYRMLTAIEKNIAELTEADKGFSQIKDDMKGMQRRGVESSADLVPIHPGLARYMREKGVWNAKWDARVAKAK
jgi:TRAP-type uncharacterized transport system substrate-binding protein